jgi:diguanylate cyclase (GGDEF)-like protein
VLPVGPVNSCKVSDPSRIARTIGVVVLLGVGIRLVNGVAPVAAAALVGVLALGASAYGLWANGRFQGRVWCAAWIALGMGLLGVIGVAVIEALDRTGAPATSPSAVTLFLGSAALALLGLVSLIRQRLPGRAAEALAEAFVAALALGVVLAALVLARMHTARDIPSMCVPLLDLVVLWVAVSLISMTPQHPVAYRYLIAGFGCVFAASSVNWVLTVLNRSSWVPLDAVLLWGACLWAGAMLHPSQRSKFDPVPARSTKPSVAHATLLMVCTLVVPGVLLARLFTAGADRDPGLALGATVLPVVIVVYLLHRVFAHAAAEYRAQHDPLTGICNRTLFEERLKSSLTQAERSGTAVGVMYLDVDRFKSINDSLGHAVGNQVLQAVVKRLQGCLRSHDTVARMGGDEFTLLLPGVNGKEQCAAFAARTVQAFSDPIAIGGRQLSVQTSVGIALYPDDGDDAETLLKNADTAMYQAKSSGRNTFEVYDSAMSALARLRFALETSLRAAVESGRLAMHYQPKYLTATGEIAGVEALARWRHPRLGFIPPWAFIPLAEESTLVETLGEWVLETVCRQAQKWRKEGLLKVPVSVNMSPRQFARQPVVAMISDVLDRTGLPANLLEIEVTESVLVEHRDEVTQALGRLRSMGVRCSIDDFGTGYSALTYLADFPVDAIKIDRSFVTRIDSDLGASSIVAAVIALAHSLGLEVVAEGVETDSQVEFLRARECDQVQGFRFSRAVPADEFEALLSGPNIDLATDDAATERSLAPFSVLSPSRLDAVLDGIVQRGRTPELLDLDGIESVLAALQRDDLLVVKDPRPFGAFPARLALGTLAGLTSLTGGLAAAGAIPQATQRLALRLLETGTGFTAPPTSAPTTTEPTPPAPGGGSSAGSPNAQPRGSSGGSSPVGEASSGSDGSDRVSPGSTAPQTPAGQSGADQGGPGQGAGQQNAMSQGGGSGGASGSGGQSGWGQLGGQGGGGQAPGGWGAGNGGGNNNAGNQGGASPSGTGPRGSGPQNATPRQGAKKGWRGQGGGQGSGGGASGGWGSGNQGGGQGSGGGANGSGGGRGPGGGGRGGRG